jgi:hypothetical protein
MARQHADALASFHSNRADGRKGRRQPETHRPAAAPRHGRLAGGRPRRRASLPAPRHRRDCLAALRAARRAARRSTGARSSSPRSPAKAPRCCAGSGRPVAMPTPSASRSKPTPSSPARRPASSAHGGTEQAFAATRSLTVSFALHLAILAALGEDPSQAAQRILETPQEPSIDAGAGHALPVCAPS